MSTRLPNGVAISAPITPEYAQILTSDALTFLAKKQVIAAVVAVVLSLLIIGALTQSHAFGETDQTTAFAAPVEP